MTSAGGPGYRWRGKNIRTIRRQKIDCVTLPRKDSYIVLDAKIKPNTLYRVYISAKNGGGNGLIAARFSAGECESQPSYVVSRDFHNVQIDIQVRKTSSKSTTLEIYRPPKSSGNILISAVSYQAVRKTKPLPEVDLEAIENQKIQERVRQISHRQNVLEHQERIRRLEQISKTRKIGQSLGVKWQGRNIQTVQKFGVTCAHLASADSLLLLPISVTSKSVYRIVITAHKQSSSGNGELLANFSAGKGYDGPIATFKVNGSAFRDYSLNVQTPIPPAGKQVYFRIWRSKVSGGNIIIKDIRYTYLREVKIIPKPRIRPKKKKDFVARRPTGEDKIMKFRPYSEVSSHIAERVNEVLVTDASQVPKVSIITPTRDNLDLLSKCWIALKDNTAYPNWEWIVGDSNSTDGTVEFMNSIDDARVKFIERGTTEGSFSSINNELVKQSDGEYVLFLNDDTEPLGFWLHNMMCKIHRRPHIGIVGAKLLYAPSKIQHAGIAFMDEGPGNLGKSVLKSFPKGFADYDRYYQAVTGACLLMRRADFDAVDGFDERYWFCYDDMDLCMKVKHNLKKKILYVADAEVIHKESVTQNKFKTGGEKQKAGIAYFKKTWVPKAEKDFYKYMKLMGKGRANIDISFVTCVNNLHQYTNYVMGSLLRCDMKRTYELIPILNFGNKYSASQALNVGKDRAKGKIIIFIHQDVAFFKDWVDLLYERIDEIEKEDKKWGVLGTAGITEKDDTIGIVYNTKGRMQWQSTKKVRICKVQTVDEHCMIIRGASKLRFDERYSGFHLYGPDMCMQALENGLTNYGILCPLVHDSRSGSLDSGKREFMKYLNMFNGKWGPKFPLIRTPTSIIKKRVARTFIKFK